MNDCPFCHVEASRILAEDGPCLAFADNYPVSRGHALIIPRRHVASFRELMPDEWAAVHRLSVALIHRAERDDPSITGFNLGINDGATAGQTIYHAHIHLIPRRSGDVADPTGGIRGVIPGRARYR